MKLKPVCSQHQKKHASKCGIDGLDGWRDEHAGRQTEDGRMDTTDKSVLMCGLSGSVRRM